MSIKKTLLPFLLLTGLLFTTLPVTAQTPDDYCRQGYDYQAQGKPDEAIAAYKQALAINPQHADAHFRLGIVYQQQKKLDEAITAYKQALAINPQHADAYYNLGLILHQKGDYSAALDNLKASYKLNPADDVKAQIGISEWLLSLTKSTAK